MLRNSKGEGKEGGKLVGKKKRGGECCLMYIYVCVCVCVCICV